MGKSPLGTLTENTRGTKWPMFFIHLLIIASCVIIFWIIVSPWLEAIWPINNEELGHCACEE